MTNREIEMEQRMWQRVEDLEGRSIVGSEVALISTAYSRQADTYNAFVACGGPIATDAEYTARVLREEHRITVAFHRRGCACP